MKVPCIICSQRHHKIAPSCPVKERSLNRESQRNGVEVIRAGERELESYSAVPRHSECTKWPAIPPRRFPLALACSAITWRPASPGSPASCRAGLVATGQGRLSGYRAIAWAGPGLAWRPPHPGNEAPAAFCLHEQPLGPYPTATYTAPRGGPWRGVAGRGGADSGALEYTTRTQD